MVRSSSLRSSSAKLMMVSAPVLPGSRSFSTGTTVTHTSSYSGLSMTSVPPSVNSLATVS